MLERVRYGLFGLALAGVGSPVLAGDYEQWPRCHQETQDLLQAYLQQYGNFEPDRRDIEGFMQFNQALCKDVKAGRKTVEEAEPLWSQAFQGMVDRVSARELELKRKAKIVESG